MTIVSDNFDGKSAHSNLEITMQDTKTNSLVTFTKMVSALSEELNWLRPLFELPITEPDESTQKK
jgi:hypothetical protein